MDGRNQVAGPGLGAMRDPRAMDGCAEYQKYQNSQAPMLAERPSEMSTIMHRSDNVEKLSALVRDRAGYVESRMLSPVPSVATDRGGKLQPEPNNVLAVLNDRLIATQGALEIALATIDRLQRELCD